MKINSTCARSARRLAGVITLLFVVTSSVRADTNLTQKVVQTICCSPKCHEMFCNNIKMRRPVSSVPRMAKRKSTTLSVIASIVLPWKWFRKTDDQSSHLSPILAAANMPQPVRIPVHSPKAAQIFGQRRTSRALSVGFQPGGAMLHLDWDMPASIRGIEFNIESSDDLVNWVPLATTRSNTISFPLTKDNQNYRVISHAQESIVLTLQWNPSTDDPAIVTGYALYHTTGQTTTRVDAGMVLTHSILVSPHMTYYIFVTAYEAHGIESIPSNIVEYRSATPVPVVVRISIK